MSSVLATVSLAMVLAQPVVAGGHVDEARPDDRTGASGGYFGYVGIDCGADYLSEVASFTNLDQLCVYDPSDVTARLGAFADSDVRALVDVHALLFEEAGPPGGSGVGFDLRDDYVERWRQFVDVNRSVLDPAHVGAFYVADEPTWLGVTTEELRTAAELIDADLPSIPLVIVEAHQALGELEVPTVIDWIGMDYYGAIDPTNSDAGSEFAWINAMWDGYFAELKARRSRPDQRIILVFDAQFSDAYRAVGYTESSLAEFVRNYRRLMAADDDVIALIGYVYFSGLDPGTLGLRDLPQVVIDANRQVGEEITGK